MAIDQVISVIPQAGKRGVDARTLFVTKQEAFQDTLTGTTVTQLNTYANQLNVTEININNKEASAVEAALIAAGAANYKSDWVANFNSGTGYSRGMSVSYTDGFRYISKIDGNLAEPSGVTDANWYKITSGYQYLSKSANYTAVANDFIYADTSAASFTVTLPATPIANDVVAILDNTSSFATNPLTIGRNGNNIMGLVEDMVVDVANISFELIYNGIEWRLK